MLTFNHSSGLYEFFSQYNVGESVQETPTTNGYWTDFMSRWANNVDIVGSNFAVTEEQQARFDEINKLGTREDRSFYLEEASLFVEFGAVHPNSTCPFLDGRKEDPVVQEAYLESIRLRKYAELANYRFSKEIAGINVNGSFVKTDRESQSQINSTFTSLSNGLVDNASFKTRDGWVPVTLETMRPIAEAVAKHVRKCFKCEELAEIELQKVTDWEELLSFSVKYEFDKAFKNN